RLGTVRAEVDRGGLDRVEALQAYTGLVGAVFRIYPALEGGVSIELTRQAHGVIALGQARAVLGEEDGAVAGVLAAGRLATGDAAQLAGLVATQRYLFGQAVGLLSDDDRAAFTRLSGTDALLTLSRIEDRLVAQDRDGALVPVDSQ